MRNTWPGQPRRGSFAGPDHARRGSFADAATDEAIERASEVMPAVLTALGAKNFSLESPFTYVRELGHGRSVEADVSVPLYGNPQGASARFRLGWDERSVTHRDGTINTTGVITVHPFRLWGRVASTPLLCLDVTVSGELDRERVATVRDRPYATTSSSTAQQMPWRTGGVGPFTPRIGSGNQGAHR